MRPTCMTIFEKSFSTSYDVDIMPEGHECIVQTSANITIAFWNPLTGAYDATTAVNAPLGTIRVPHHKARFGTGTTAAVRVVTAI